MKKIAAIIMLSAAMLLPTVIPATTSNVTAQAASFTMGEITANNVRVRRGPGTNYDALGQVHKGQMFRVVGTSGDWKKIEYNKNGVKYGYVYYKYVEDHTCYR